MKIGKLKNSVLATMAIGMLLSPLNSLAEDRDESGAGGVAPDCLEDSSCVTGAQDIDDVSQKQ